MLAEQARRILALVDQDTGEFEEVPRANYAFDGAHINVGIRKGRELASAASGLTDREFRVLVWYWFATETSEEAIMRTGSAIAEELGMSPDALSRAVKVLKQARCWSRQAGWGGPPSAGARPTLHSSVPASPTAKP